MWYCRVAALFRDAAFSTGNTPKVVAEGGAMPVLLVTSISCLLYLVGLTCFLGVVRVLITLPA